MSSDVDVRQGENPFAEALEPGPPEPLGLLPWTEGLSPFAEVSFAGESVDEATAMLAEALDALEVDGFDEAVADLVAETSAVVADRFQGEYSGSMTERERLGDAHLAPLRIEAERYVDSLSERMAGMDVASLSDEQFESLLDSLEPATGPLSPASEQLFGNIAKKVRSAAGFVVKAAKSAAGAVGKVAGGLLTAALEKLRGLIPKLLQRVLSFAIGRLPVPLQAPARALAARFRFESEDESEVEAFAAVDEFDEESLHGFSPAVATDTNELAAQFDEAFAEVVVTSQEDEQPEAFGGEAERPVESTELEQLAEARDALVSTISEAQDGEDLAPAIESFVPALLPALRVGINLAGRQRVVGFLAKYLGGLIRGYVGPTLSRPLATAIVDTGLRLVSLEAEDGRDASESEAETAATALAATVEDTVRRLAENEEYVFENDELLQLAAADAFEQAVATNFPARLVKPRLQQAPGLGGSFVTRGVRSPHPFRRYSRVPEVEVTEQIADALRTFGGTTLGAELRAAGVAFPVRARLHVFEAIVGTTVPALAAADRRLARLGRGHAAWRNLHPLTPKAAGLLLREPRLGVPVPQRYLAHRARVAVGQRLYWLEPIGAAGAGAPTTGGALASSALAPTGAATAIAAAASARRGTARASRSRATIDLRTGTVRIAVYLSEPESQAVAAEIRQGRGVPALLRAMSQGLRRLRFRAGDRSVVVRTQTPQREDLAAQQVARMTPDVLAALRRRLGAWFLTMVAQWARTRGEEFTRAAADPADGTTVVLSLTAVPGIALIGAAVGGRLGPAELRSLTSGAAMRGTPSGTVTVVAGRRLR